MADAHSRRCQRLLVGNPAGAEIHRQLKAVQHQLPQHLQLDGPHHMAGQLPEACIPSHPKRRILILQLAEGRQHLRVGRVRPQHPGLHHRPQSAFPLQRLKADTLPRPQPGYARHSAERPRLRFLG